MALTTREVATALGAPFGAVDGAWPLVVAALDAQGIRSDLVEVAVAATIQVETAGRFAPIHEFGGKDPAAYFTRLYEHRLDLGNVLPGDGALFHGRGFVQITGRANYRAAGAWLRLPLEVNPDLALDPQVSARILAHFFKVNHIDVAANAQDWRKTRRLVNGGYNGWDLYNAGVCKLLEVLDV